MPSYAYENLGGITGVGVTGAKPYSKRGKDRDRYQNFIFECDPLTPFTGVVHVQGSLSDPQEASETTTWADIARLTFTNEGGTCFVQFELELAAIRVNCKQGNYTGGKIKSIHTMR